ncbi:unnamed protein product [Urochloa decumbens]|uniref:Uncharacterized protein n=1 Tax=Urochloa decumbens TaxID=240449 RepID=A0ABC9E0J8_9POAL
MSFMSKAISDPPVDLEKGVTGLKAAATEEEGQFAVVNPRLATCIRATLDVIVVAYSLFLIGVTAWMVKVSDNWWDPWPAVLIFSAIMLWAFWMTPKVKDGFVQKYAMKRTPPSDNDVTTKLLPSKE